jgi:Nicastrin small lobe
VVGGVGGGGLRGPKAQFPLRRTGALDGNCVSPMFLMRPRMKALAPAARAAAGVAPHAFSPADAFPSAAYSPYPARGYAWNPDGSGLSRRRFRLPIALLDANTTADARRRAAANAAQVGGESTDIFSGDGQRARFCERGFVATVSEVLLAVAVT